MPFARLVPPWIGENESDGIILVACAYLRIHPSSRPPLCLPCFTFRLSLFFFSGTSRQNGPFCSLFHRYFPSGHQLPLRFIYRISLSPSRTFSFPPMAICGFSGLLYAICVSFALLFFWVGNHPFPAFFIFRGIHVFPSRKYASGPVVRFMCQSGSCTWLIPRLFVHACF
jgi:hypothetical protein